VSQVTLARNRSLGDRVALSRPCGRGSTLRALPRARFRRVWNRRNQRLGKRLTTRALMFATVCACRCLASRYRDRQRLGLGDPELHQIRGVGLRAEDHAPVLRIASARPHALTVLADRFLLAQRKRIVEFAAAKRLPGMYPYREYVDAGGLMSYAPSNIELFRGAATYVDKILKGVKPGDLPVQEPTKFELIVNLKNEKVIGIDVPTSVLLRADEVIE
jgi:hypothetical protein